MTTPRPRSHAHALLAAASCSGSDVVLILKKMRIDLQDLRIDVAGRGGNRNAQVTAIHFNYHMAGTGLDQSRQTVR